MRERDFVCDASTNETRLTEFLSSPVMYPASPTAASRVLYCSLPFSNFPKMSLEFVEVAGEEEEDQLEQRKGNATSRRDSPAYSPSKLRT